jgi:hypothetical protein
MNRILRPALAVAAALLLGNAAPEDQGFICVAIGSRWQGSLADTDRIEAVPVPASYRLRFESTEPCVHFWLDKAGLVTWHQRFGSERSVTAALAYLERHYVGDARPVERFESDLNRAWRRALPDLGRAKAMRQPEGLDHSLRHRFMKESRPVQRLQALVRAREDYRFLAEQYLRAAEEFNSPALLGKAASFLTPVVQGETMLGPLERQEPFADLLYFNLDIFITEDLKMRIAVLRAKLNRSPADIAAADRLLSSLRRENYQQIAEAAYSEGEDFCDISHGSNDAEALRTACREDNQLNEKVTNYWINRAMLDLVSDSKDPDSVELALRLLDHESRGGRRCCGRSAEEDELRLHLQQADHHRRRLAAASAGGDRKDAADPWREALSALQKAERLAPVTSSPARFERIARAWLAIWQSGPAVFDGIEHLAGMTKSPEHRRYATYLRRLLSVVDAIATGADSGLSPESASPASPQ